ncbi:zinc-ribbon domain-containing protein [uncultured Methanobrevibacter sp.]|uniref:zinc-ribbon domain-containing protein n=1 Tax=uncultured Methanobrevibacter sp. TaxID=253161 RepID=UPI0025E10BC6|nr:zinc ribbon domain-containing protein [uncultured Methanobrevibacter sp.]
MNCPKCNEEIDEDSTFCPSCGEQITAKDTKKCPKCGTSNQFSVSFCSSCGYNFNSNESNDLQETSRTIELVLGILAAVLGFFASFIALFFSAFTDKAAFVFICIVFFSILGLVSTFYVKRYHEVGGIGMVISGVCLLLTGGMLGFISSILFIIGGLLGIFRK